jgi:hypothetical protein
MTPCPNLEGFRPSKQELFARKICRFQDGWRANKKKNKLSPRISVADVAIPAGQTPSNECIQKEFRAGKSLELVPQTCALLLQQRRDPPSADRTLRTVPHA